MSDARTRPRFLMVDGQFVEYETATVHVLSAAFKYGTIVFEGLRGYWNEQEDDLFLFRVHEHLVRLERSAKAIDLEIPFASDAIFKQLVDLVRKNDLREDLHARIQVFVTADDGRMSANDPVSVVVAAIPMGRYFTNPGVTVGVSSWRRIPETASPARIKAVPNYHNSRLALLEARKAGYDDAIILNDVGNVTEGPGYNIFMVRDGVLVTPPVTDSILEGVTRDTILHVGKTLLGLNVVERSINRSELLACEELFFCGSAAELTPIVSVNMAPVGQGEPGPVTLALGLRYHALASGAEANDFGWISPVYGKSQ